MTYCVAIRMREGMVFVADSRTNAGVDHIATFRKMHLFPGTDDNRAMVLMSAGNLATTQSVVSLLRQLDSEGNGLNACDSFYAAAELVGRTARSVVERDAGPRQEHVDFGSSFILGGQIRGDAMRLFHIYPEGNFIEASEDTPYLQIGEIKYGKPIIDRVISIDTPLDQGVKCALISMDSTIRSNLSVGMPLDLLIYHKDSFSLQSHYDIHDSHEGYQQLREAWSRGLADTFQTLPDMPWRTD